MASAYQLFPDEKVWANTTVISLYGGEAQPGVITLPGYGGRAAAAVGGVGTSGGGGLGSGGVGSGPETYRATQRDLAHLLGKIDAYAPGDGSSQMVKAYKATLALGDIWQAPPVPVICLIGAGNPTRVGFGYREPWPRNMNEEPCTTAYEDGDGTVPLRSSESVCRTWAEQRRCHAPLSTAHPLAYKGRSNECVDTVFMHCRAPNMESADGPRGTDHCAELHARILHKVCLLCMACKFHGHVRPVCMSTPCAHPPQGMRVRMPHPGRLSRAHGPNSQRRARVPRNDRTGAYESGV